ncbi:Ig-like V-type domain-containing protein FAM187A [Branchiostoma lanceolatum]|uniref:Ig-like V-type domain-containing protein FAM187A n=1 Tax=Branchiostoma lanceolatum TaxID=7740 RepID=UPI0034532E76
MAVARVLTLFTMLIPTYISSTVLSTSLSNLTSSDNSSFNQTFVTQLVSPGTLVSRKSKAALFNQEFAKEVGRRSRRKEPTGTECPGLSIEKEIYMTQMLNLPCQCQPKGQKLLRWTFFPRGGEGEMSVWFDEDERLELGNKFDMTIRHAKVTDSGIYYCRDGDEILVLYDLTVKEPKAVKLSLVALKEDTLPNRTMGRMTMFTLWSPWGRCNRCGGSGERARIGICHVEGKDFPKHLGTVIACDSENLPAVAREVFGEEFNRPDERRVEFCTERCPKDRSLTVVTDSNGLVVSSVRRTGGIASRPTLPPPISRKTMFKMSGENITLTCPGEGMDSPVSWRNGSAVLTETELKKTTDGRIFVDIINSLNIHNLKKQDGNVYTCWMENRHVGTTKVFVRIPVAAEGWKKYSNYAGLVFVALVGLFITIMTLKHSRDKAFR